LTADIVAARGQAAGAAAQGAAQAATVPVDLCIEVTALQQSSELGQAAQWSVAVWATGGSVPDAVIGLLASPAGTGTPQFSFGCGSSDGTSTCNLGTMDAASAQQQLQASLTVPLTATVTAVSLTATVSASGQLTGPAATVPVAVLGSTTPIGGATLPAGLLPSATVPGSTVSPSGSAAGLFPTPAQSSPSAVAPGTRQVESTSAPRSGDAQLAAEVVGLVALAAAFALAVTRVSIRRPAGTGKGAATGAAPTGTAPLPAVPGEPPSGEAGGAEGPPDVLER
jgi:hypothetical protein